MLRENRSDAILSSGEDLPIDIVLIRCIQLHTKEEKRLKIYSMIFKETHCLDNVNIGKSESENISCLVVTAIITE